MVRQVKGLAAKPEHLSLILGPVWWRELLAKDVLSPPLHVPGHSPAYAQTRTDTR